MNDFLKTFENISTIELLKILKNPNDYQPEAVLAAEEVLAKRDVTDEERNSVEAKYNESLKKAKKEADRNNWINSKLRDYFNLVTQPGEEVSATKWLSIFLLLITIQYTWALYNDIKFIISFVLCEYCELNIYQFGNILMMLYVPLVFYLLLKRKRWGWILLFADNLFSAISKVFQIFRFYENNDYTRIISFNFLISLAIHFAFLFFLWKNDIAQFFNIDERRKKNYAFRIGIVDLALVLIMIASVYVS